MGTCAICCMNKHVQVKGIQQSKMMTNLSAEHLVECDIYTVKQFGLIDEENFDEQYFFKIVIVMVYAFY